MCRWNAHADALRRLDPDNPRLQHVTNADRIVVSEPPGDLAGPWLEIPESTPLIIQPGPDEQQPVHPHAP
jgi:glutamine amidotransferase